MSVLVIADFCSRKMEWLVVLEWRNSRVIRSSCSAHTIWINFRSLCIAPWLLLIQATLSPNIHSHNSMQTRQVPLRWAEDVHLQNCEILGCAAPGIPPVSVLSWASLKSPSVEMSRMISGCGETLEMSYYISASVSYARRKKKWRCRTPYFCLPGLDLDSTSMLVQRQT